MNLAEAIASLDPKNDEHWTESGVPKLDVIKELTGQSYSRKEVTEAAPKVTREALLLGQDTSVKPPQADVAANPEVKLAAEPKADEAVAEDALSKAKAALESIEAERYAAEQVFKEAKIVLDDLTAKRDKLSQEVDSLTPKPNTMSDIQFWLKRQHEIRLARGPKQGPSDLDKGLRLRARPARGLL
jgi:hypothetical protein